MKARYSGHGLVAGAMGWLRWLLMACLLAGGASTALAGKTYTDNGDGTVIDPTTGLVWMRCSMGQTWSGSTCTGTATGYAWTSANALTGTSSFAGHSDWRLPNIRELQTIVDRSVWLPAIDSVAFPTTPSSDFWSGSSNAVSSNYAWYVYFNYGRAGSYYRSVNYSVRLVRGGQSLGLLDMARPSTDYVDQGDGTVTHSPTGLMWQRCVVGQVWSGSSCTGSASTHTWDAANLLTSSFAGHSDWRLPTEDELLSLVDYTKSEPVINTTLFPNTPSSNFWSGSPYANNSGSAWYVGFSNGGAYDYSRSFSNSVRLVRVGQCVGPLVLSVSKTGAGQISSRVGTGIDCGTGASGYYAGDVVTLTATPAASLISWGGACTSSGTAATCTVTMDAAKSVSASFMDTPVISGFPTALTFALQNIGSTSAAQSVTLTNSGTAALTIASISASGDYGVTHNCGTGLGVGGFCTLSVRFSPTASGTRTGSVTITSNAPGSPHSMALSGSGQGSTSVVSPGSLSFASQGVGSPSVAKSVTLSNNGGLVLNISSIAANGDFAVSSTTCGATLVQATSCSISIVFAPTVTGARSGNLLITSDGIGSPNTISLTGTGVAVPAVTLSLTSLSFPIQPVGISSAAQTITLTNAGEAILSLTSIAASGDFAVTNNCGSGLGIGGACSLSAIFTPSVSGTRTGAITIASNAPGSPHSVNLSGGSGIATQTIIFGTAPTVVAGGNGTVSATASSGLGVTFSSLTPSTCTVSGSTVTGVSAGTCTVAANQAGNGTYSAATQVTQSVAVAPPASTGTLITRYRLYSDGTHEHLYTTDLNEYNVLSAGKSWLAEGAIYKLYQGAGSLAGVDAVQYYRLYNPSSYQHHWTTDLNEYNVLGAGGWSKEGVDGYILPTAVTGSVPLYRLYLNAFGGLHLWTTDANEKKVLSTSNGWIDEGVAGYVVPLP